MKKTIFFGASLLLLSLSGISQTLNFEITDVTYGSGVISNNAMFEHVTRPATTIKHFFDIKNTSSGTQVILIKKSVILANSVAPTDEALMYYCTGETCYDASTMTSSLSLAKDETLSFTADIDEASETGVSSVDYKFTNAGSSITLGLRYNRPETVSIGEESNLLSNASAAYPNPSSSKTFININSPKQLNDVKVVVLNTLGSVVFSKHVNIASGKNTVSIESENFNSGIYFATISYGNSVVTKKITITK